MKLRLPRAALVSCMGAALVSCMGATLVSCGGPEAAPGPGLRLAERGIGGTGGVEDTVARPLPAPAGAPSALPRLPSDRGIGGTGVASAARAGTGIAGTITGFGSIFVDGLEVGLGAAPRITIDGAAASLEALRVGQVAILSAGPVLDGHSSTHSVAIRHEVAGRVAAIDKDGVLSVAGQPVRISPSTLGIPAPRVGDWIAVSGLRDEAGEIAATRVDRSARGQVVVHGTMRWDRGVLHIGALPVVTAAGVTLPAGGSVSASGYETGGVLRAETLAPDLLLADPAAFFGPGIRYFLIESYARSLAGGGLELEHGPRLSGRPQGLSPAPDGPAVIGFERGLDNRLFATSMQHTAWAEPPQVFQGAPSAPGGGPAYMAAPVPGHAWGPGAAPAFGGGGRGGAGPFGGFATPGLRRGGGGPAGSMPPGGPSGGH